MRKMTKSLVAGAVVTLATALTARTVDAAPCITTVLSNWLTSGFSCTVTTNGATDTFSNFTYSPDGFTKVPATVVGVGPSPTTAGSGLLFNANWENTTTTALDAVLIFTVTAPAGTTITDADLLLDGVLGPAFDVESLSNGVTLSSSDNLTHTAGFAGVTSLVVTDDIGVGAGGTISSVDKQFVTTTITEPGTLAILGIALAGLGLIGRRRRKAA